MQNIICYKSKDLFGFDMMSCYVQSDGNRPGIEVDAGLPEKWHDWNSDDEWIGDWTDIDINIHISVSQECVVMCVCVMIRALIELGCPGFLVRQWWSCYISNEDVEKEFEILSALLSIRDDENPDYEFDGLLYCGQITESAKNNIEDYILSMKDEYEVNYSK